MSIPVYSIQALDVISVNIWSILISLANLLIIYLIIKKLLFRPIQNILSARKSYVESIYAEADSAKREAEEEKEAYREQLSHAKEDASEIIRTANERANAMSREIIAEADRKAASALKKADEDISFEKKKAVNDMKNELAGLSVALAEKMIEREINPDDHRRLIDDFIKSVDV